MDETTLSTENPTASPEAAQAAAPEAAAPVKDAERASPLGTQPAPAPEAKPAAPEATAPSDLHDFDLTKLTVPDMPEGVVVTPEDLSAFTTFAKESKLTTAQAQAVLDYGLQRNAAAVEQMVQLKSQWESSLKADKELGGENITVTIATAQRAMEKYDQSGTISQILHASGYGTHPDIVRFMYNVGKGIGEDMVPNGGSSGRAELPLEERLYPTYKP